MIGGERELRWQSEDLHSSRRRMKSKFECGNCCCKYQDWGDSHKSKSAVIVRVKDFGDSQRWRTAVVVVGCGGLWRWNKEVEDYIDSQRQMTAVTVKGEGFR